MNKASWFLAAAVATAPLYIVACGSSEGDNLFDQSGTPGIGGATGGTAGATGGTAGATGGTAGATGGTAGATGGTAGATGGTAGATGGTAGATGGTGGATGGTGGATGGTGGATGGTGGATGGTGGTTACVPVGHDEDGDSQDDACDNCPSQPNPGQANTDGDQIGERCEDNAQPSLLDQIGYFEPFAFDGWDEGGAWWLDTKYDVEDDFVDADDDNCGGYCGANSYWQQSINGSPYSVEVSLTYEPYSFGYAGVVFAFDYNNSNGWWACLFNRTATRRELGLWHYPGNGSTEILPQKETSNVEQGNTDPDVLRWIRAYRDGNTLTCEFINEKGDVARTEAAQGSGQLDGFAGLRVYSAHVQFRSYTVYR